MNYTLRLPNRINVFIILTLIVFLTPVVTQITGNNLFKLIEDIAYMVILTHSIYIMLLHNKVVIEKSIVMPAFILLFALFSLIGIYYNGLSLVILQFREFKYLLLLIIMIPYTDREYFKNVWTVLKLIAAASVPVAVIQWIIYRDEGDRITGLLGHRGSGTLTLFVLIVFFTELGMRLKNNRKIFGLYILYLIPTLINETKITFILIPVMLITVLIMTKKLFTKESVIAFSVAAIAVIVWAYSYKIIYSESVFELFTREYVENYFYATHWEGDAGRLAKVKFAIDVIKDNNLFFGYGLGASYIGDTSGKSGFVANRYYDPNIFGGTKPQLYISIMDIGLIGTILLILILISFFVNLIRQKHQSLEKFISVNSFVVLFATLLYQNIFYTYQIMYILVLYSVLANKNESSEPAGSVIRVDSQHNLMRRKMYPTA